MPPGSLPLPTIVAPPTLRRDPAFWTAAGLLLLVLAASGVPTPLYRVYQEQFGFGPGTLTAVFGIYALALLAALLVVGGLSDHVGRRPVLVGGLLLQAASMVVFLTADSVGWLLTARVVQGLSMGALTGTLGAMLLDNQRPARPLGPLVNSAGPGIGLSLGAVGAGLVVEHVASPTRWLFAVLTAVLLLAAVAATTLPETSPGRPGALGSLRPSVRVPRPQRAAFLTALPAIVAAWALGGLYLSLGPSLVAGVFGIDDHLVGSLLVLAMQGTAALAAVLGRDLAPERAMVLGASVFAVGVTGTIAALVSGAVAVLFASAVVSGLGFGLAFLGAVATASAGVAPGERAGLLSSVFVAGYLSFSVPAVVAGVAAGAVGLETVTEVYAAVLVALSLGAVLGVRLRRRAGAAEAAAGAVAGAAPGVRGLGRTAPSAQRPG
ncbi:MFS transporter [Blastococcus sp. MG754426]|nr:MFS transporter [Blastococcus sp. MG754426]MCF6514294.1 MFS transporter [Blastococcus sp. MG754427]